MKKQCLCCQFVCDDDLHCCPMCGQGSWVALDGSDEKEHVIAKPKKDKKDK